MSSLFFPAQSFGAFMKYHMLKACLFCAEPNLTDTLSLQRQIHQAYQLLPHSSLQ